MYIIESGGKYFTNNKNDNNNKNDDEIEFIKIKYNINRKDYNNELFLANRRIWYDNELDFIFIEIKNEEYKLDKDSLFIFKKYQKNIEKKTIITIYVYNEQVQEIVGKFHHIDIEKKIIAYDNNTEEGFSGGPVLLNSNFIIAIHSERDRFHRKGIMLECILTKINKAHYCKNENQKTNKV